LDFRLDTAAAWQAWAALGWLITWLGAFVALDLALRVPAAAPVVARRWQAAAALALGTGVWSTQVLVLATLPVSFPIGFHTLGSAGSWGLAVVAAGLGWVSLAATPAARVWRPAGAAGAGLGLFGAQLAVVASAGLRPAYEWSLPVLGAAALAALAGIGIAGAGLARLAGRRGPAPAWQRLAFAFGLAAALGVSGAALVFGADPGARSFSAYEHHIDHAALGLLASVGSTSLLLVLLFASVLEARMQARLRATTEELERRAFTDPLTDLPTHLAFKTQIAEAVQRADVEDRRLALLHISLDNFKQVNEQFDHQTGDRMLEEIAARLRTLLRPADQVARLGGDEFLMLVGADPDAETTARIAANVLASIDRPCRLDGREAVVSCSIGIALFPEHGAMSALFKHADAAMRAAKSGGGATYAFFEAHMMSGAREQGLLLRDLRTALAKGQLELVYQPKVHAPSGAITGAEALMRWHHPERGLVSPAVFIPIAERFGLIGELGHWVIDEACRQAREWRDRGLRMRVAINLSAQQLRQPGLAEHIQAALGRHQINPQLLTCEMTESVAMEFAESTMKIFEKLARVGVHISIDDFGTGYSSLAQLRKLPAEELKIDRGFVQDLEASAEARAVVDAVIKLAQALGKKVIAEGVETDGQYRILQALGCDEVQGFLFHKPMSARALGLLAMGHDRDPGHGAVAFRDSLFKETLPTALH